ncbi:Acetyl-coenzyme A transferase nodX (Nodulisporic acid biosynthesis cluster protein X) [Durusdinium trenchii]|uniref:Acetyl-coenzyme A transferase nodX (Nodulisporic acid biosynthesis cluster protein X) n=1 Tax=Durusdinium trenchii TaxID=1381693 RepID=A0ABP0JIW9_9DINO
MKRVCQDSLDTEAEAGLAEAKAELAAVKAKVEATENEVAATRKKLEGITTLLDLKNRALDEKWTELEANGSAARYGSIQAYVTMLKEEKADSKDVLARQERALAKLREEKATALRTFEAAINAVRDTKGRRVSGRKLVALENLNVPFKAEARRFTFDFVEIPEFQQVLEVCESALRQFLGGAADDGTNFSYPVISGASGCGKTRLGWEVCQRIVKEFSAAHPCVIFHEVAIPKSPPGESAEPKDLLAEVLVKGLLRRKDAKAVFYDLESVLQKIQADLDARVVLLQLDECSHNPELVQILARECRTLFRASVFASTKANPFFVTLSGVDDVPALEASFCKSFGIRVEAMGRLRHITAAFGGFPRFYEWLRNRLYRQSSELLLRDLRDAERCQLVDVDTLAPLFDSLLSTYAAIYPFELWERILGSQDKQDFFQPYSAQTRELARRAIRVVHSLAISGLEVSADCVVVQDAGRTFSLNFVATIGLFSLASRNRKVVVVIPPLAIAAFNLYSGALSDARMLSPSSYSWDTLQLLAMDTFRAQWNARFFAHGEHDVSVCELRPGVLQLGVEPFPVVRIDKELGGLVRLASPLQGNWDDDFSALNMSRGRKVHIDPGHAFLAAPNQPGLDGFIVGGGVAVLNQTKSVAAVAVEQSGISAADLNLLSRKMSDVADPFNFGNAVGTMVFDVFTNRTSNLQEDSAISTAGRAILLTTAENFKDVVGPVFAVEAASKRVVWDNLSRPALRTPWKIEDAAMAVLAAVGLTADPGGSAEIRVRQRLAAAAIRQDRYVLRNHEPITTWDKLSGIYQAGDGRWIQFHCNFQHHRDSVLGALGFDQAAFDTVERPQVEQAVAKCDSAEALEQRVAENGGCAAVVYSRIESEATVQSRAAQELALFEIEAIGKPGSRSVNEPLQCLDLTRILAGPMGARTLGDFGARVMRVASPHLAFLETAVLFTGHGKRSCHLDLTQQADRDTLEKDLLPKTDVVINAYRQRSLDKFGLSAEDLARRFPGIVVVELSAYSRAGPWAEKRGFDSLVQCFSGLAFQHSQALGRTMADAGSPPCHLPAQFLDYVTGYLASAAALSALEARRKDGRSRVVRLSLLQTAQWLKIFGEMPSDAGWSQAEDLPADKLEHGDLVDTRLASGEVLTTLRAPLDTMQLGSPPVALGTHPPTWG